MNARMDRPILQLMPFCCIYNFVYLQQTLVNFIRLLLPYKNTTLKKLSALVLLTVMVSITCVKVLHKHHYPCLNLAASVDATRLKAVQVIALHQCTICSFEFFKNADGHTPTFQVKSFISFAPFATCIIPAVFKCKIEIATLRGPPDMV